MVGTPIGNLDDLSPRAREALEGVSLIAAEDTRRTRKLLSHLGLNVPLLSCHEHNELSRVKTVLGLLEKGEDVAFVSDAGTPGLSDPGSRLVQKVSDAGYKVIPVPGPSAVTTALSVAGMSGDTFFFRGFLPAKRAERRKAIEELKAVPHTLVFFEAPHRISDALSDMLEILGDRRIVLARELTKVHEELLRGNISGVLREIQTRKGVKGEITLVVEGAGEIEAESGKAEVRNRVAQALEILSPCEGLSVKDLAELLAGLTGFPRKEIYKMALRKREKHEET